MTFSFTRQVLGNFTPRRSAQDQEPENEVEDAAGMEGAGCSRGERTAAEAARVAVGERTEHTEVRPDPKPNASRLT